MRSAFRLLKEHTPLAVGVGLAIALLVSFVFQTFTWFSPMGWSYAFDHFTLPRCGLSIRFGLDPFQSDKDFAHFGPFATNWVTHPAMCVVLGAPLSYLPPWFGFWLMTLAYFAIHLFSFVAFGRTLAPAVDARTKTMDTAFFVAMGVFFPWYLIYVLGQYHAFVVLALTLVLVSERYNVIGFSISALGKPILAPGALVLLVQRRFKDIALISAVCLVGYGGFAFLRYDVTTGLRFGYNPAFEKFFEMGSMYMKFSVPGWNQEMGLSKVLDEFTLPANHFPIRRVMAGIPVALAVALAMKGRHKLALAVSTLWYPLMNGRGHEYHYVLLGPILAYAYCESSGKYRNPLFVGLAFLCALPTTYPILMKLGNFVNANDSTHEALRNLSPVLYWLFLLHRPFTVLALLLFVIVREFLPPTRSKASLSTP